MDKLSQSPLSICVTKAGLGAGTTTTYSTTAAVVFSERGKMYSAPIATNAATPTLDADTGLVFNPLLANQGCTFLFGYTGAGVISVTQSPIMALDATGNFLIAPQLPAIANGVTPFGYLVAKAGSTLASGWVLGTSNLSGVTGMTYTFQDIMNLPDRPQVS